MNIDIHAKWKSERAEGDISFRLGDSKPHHGPVPPGEDNTSPGEDNTSDPSWTWDDLKSLLTFLTLCKKIKESEVVTDVGSLILDLLSNAGSYVSTWWLVFAILRLLSWLFTMW